MARAYTFLITLVVIAAAFAPAVYTATALA